MLQYLCETATLIPDPDLKVRDDHMIPGELRPSSLQIRPSELAVEMSVRQMDVIQSHRIPDLSLGCFQTVSGRREWIPGVFEPEFPYLFLYSGIGHVRAAGAAATKSAVAGAAGSSTSWRCRSGNYLKRDAHKELLSSWPEDPLAMYSSSIAELQNRFYDGQIDVYQYCQQHLLYSSKRLYSMDRPDQLLQYANHSTEFSY